MYLLVCGFFFQAEDGIRDLVRSRGLGDVYKRQQKEHIRILYHGRNIGSEMQIPVYVFGDNVGQPWLCLLYTSDAADERSSVDLGGRRIIKKKTHERIG